MKVLFSHVKCFRVIVRTLSQVPLSVVLRSKVWRPFLSQGNGIFLHRGYSPSTRAPCLPSHSVLSFSIPVILQLFKVFILVLYAFSSLDYLFYGERAMLLPFFTSSPFQVLG
jgi:hypothetical protein